MNSATDSSTAGESRPPEPVDSNPVSIKNEHVCVHCSRSYNSQEELLEHLKAYTTNNNNTSIPSGETNNTSTPGKQNHMCLECGEVLSTPYSLKRHLLTHSGLKPYQCEFCDKRYKHAYLLTHHLNTHAGHRPFRCDECAKDFTSPNMLRRHKQVHIRQHHQCDHCEQHFQRIDYLDKHLANDHKVSRDHLCLVCGKSFTFETMLQEHIAMHNKYADIPEENLKCDLCNTKFSRVSSLNRHKKQIHGFDTDGNGGYEKSSYFKKINNSVDTDESDEENDHCENTTPKKDTVVFCSFCGKSFARSDSLKRHIIAVHENNAIIDAPPYEPVLSFPESKAVVHNHVEESSNPCEQCGMEFTTIDLLQMHKAVVHPGENKLEAELLLAVHEKMIEEKIQIQKMVEKKIEENNANSVHLCPPGQNMSNHVTVKTEAGTIDCTSCKTHFVDSNSYQNHIPICVCTLKSVERQKTSDKPMQDKIVTPRSKVSPGSGPKKGRQKCEECGKYFADNYCLKRHMISHTGEKKHECDVCGKRFAHSFHLTSHKKIHLGIRDYKCEICAKTFTVNHALQRHLLTHPSTVVYTCMYCEKKFANEASMQKHQLTCH